MPNMESNLEFGESLLKASPREMAQKASKIRSTAIFIIIVVLVFFNILVANLLYTPPPYKMSTSPTAHCGSSRDEAKSTGCHFDPMSFSWLPTDCYDAELTKSFLGLKEWQWFTDADGSPAPHESVLRGDYDELFVSWEYHLLHCTYTWRKMHRALLRGKPVDNYIGKYNHTAHCEMMLLAQHIERNSTNTIIQTKFVSC